MRGVLGLAVELWTFGSPKGLQISNFSKCWASPPHLAKVGLRHTNSTVSSNPIALEKYKAMASTTIVNLNKSEWDFELQNFLVENECDKVQEGQKEHDLTLTQLEPLTIEVKLLNFETSHSKIWIKGLLHQIHLMSNGQVCLTPHCPLTIPPPCYQEVLEWFLWNHALFVVYISSVATSLCHHVDAHITPSAWGYIWKLMVLIVPSLCVGNS